MALNLEVNILGDYKKLTKATKGAEKGLTRFGKHGASISKKLGRAFAGLGGAFAAAKIGHFMLDAAKAAGEDQRAQRLLAMTLERNAKAKASDVKATEDMIGRMELATGIADNELRPAMGKLAAATGSVNKAQELLKVALGVSAKYGKPLDTVVQALGKAFNGNTTSLTRMIPQLKNSKDVFKDLKADVKGFAQENADPFERFNRGLDRFKELVGGPLAKKFGNLMDKIATPGSPEARAVDTLAGSMEGLASSFATFFRTFDPKGTSGFVGFVNALNTSIKTMGVFLEIPNAWQKTLSGQKLNPADFPGLYQATAGNRKAQANAKFNEAADKIWNQQRAFTQMGGQGLGIKPTTVYNVTIKPTTSMTPDETVKMIRAWEKKHGVKYSGPVR